MTDEAGQYAHLDKEFASHEYVNHSAGEYGRGDVHTNTLEGFYSIFKRGMKGVYQHCSEKHLHRYVAEFDFRYATALRSVQTIWNAPKNWQGASLESALPIGGLVKPRTLKQNAAKLLRIRRKITCGRGA